MRKTLYALIVAVVIGILPFSVFSAGDGPFELNPQFGIKEILQAKVGARVTVRTDSGEAIEGTVTKVGDQLLHLSRITGKDFYDAIIRVDRITSVIMKVR